MALWSRKFIFTMNSLTSRQPALRVCLFATMVTLTGCSSIQQQSVVSWREAVQATKEQSRATFETVGALVRESQLKRIETLPPDQLRQIREADIAAALSAEALRRWNLALDAMAAYAS